MQVGVFWVDFGMIWPNMAKVGFKNLPFFHFLRRFSTFLRKIEKNNGF